MSLLVTGEAVALDLQVAGVPSRILAAAVDAVAQLLIYAGFALVVSASGASEALAATFAVLGLVAAGLVYPVAMETLLRGRTLGKLALGLRVVRDDGGPIRFRHALFRGLVGLFVERPGITLGSGAVICALLNSRGKRLGDLLAGTIVVSQRVARTRHVDVEMPPPRAAWAATLDRSGRSDQPVQRGRAVPVRWAHLTPAAQAEIGGRLAAEVAAVVAPAPPGGVPDWAVLSAVVAERRRRALAEAAPAPQAYAPPPSTPAPAEQQLPSYPPEAPPSPFAPPR